MNALVLMSPEEVRDLVRNAVREELTSHRDPERDVLTAEQVADMLAVHIKTVAKLVTRDALPAHRLGREYRFNRNEVLAWLAERAVRPGAHASKHAANLQRVRAA
jgi:excisionase family DNA binding protein